MGVLGRTRRLLNGPLHRLGFDLRRWSPALDLEAARGGLIERYGVDLVIDVGANEGQYAEALRRSGYGGRVVSIEPLKTAFEVLRAASTDDPNWEAIEAAAGSGEGRMELEVAGNGVSSSLLPMLDRHLRAAPGSAPIGRETVEVSTLDRLAKPALEDARAGLLKIDTQGFEAEVLDGASEIVGSGKLAGIEIELSLVPLYEGQPLWPELSDLLRQAGFVPLALGHGFRDPRTGELLQVDGLFGPDETGRRVEA